MRDEERELKEYEKVKGSTPFIIFPAIDLRQGCVVRLVEGNPQNQTSYSQQPAETARRWLDAGAAWLHVVNLDGAFGADASRNLAALEDILKAAQPYRARVQFGGGLRSLENVEKALGMGVARAVLGTLAVQNAPLLAALLPRWGSERIAASLDARGEEVQVQGWQQGSGRNLYDLAADLKALGLRWLVYTDIARDGRQTGFNHHTSLQLARQSGLAVIASGGVRSSEDIKLARQGGLAGIIIGRALYEGNINLEREFNAG